MDGVLEPSAQPSATPSRVKGVTLLREPVHGEGNKHDQTNDLAVATASSPIITGRIVARMVVGIDSDQSDRKPSAECHSDEASNQRHQVHMAILFRDVDCGLQHQDAERNAGDPADEAYYVEDAEK